MTLTEQYLSIHEKIRPKLNVNKTDSFLLSGQI